MRKEDQSPELYSPEQLENQAQNYLQEVRLFRNTLKIVRLFVNRGALSSEVLQRQEALYKDLISLPERDLQLKNGIELLRQKREEEKKEQPVEGQPHTRKSSGAIFEIILSDKTTVTVGHAKTAKALEELVKTSEGNPIRTDDLAKTLLGTEDRQALDYTVQIISKIRNLLRPLGWQVIQSVPKGKLGLRQRGLYYLEKLPVGEKQLEKIDTVTQEFTEKIPILKIREETREVFLEGWESFKKIYNNALWRVLLLLAKNSNQAVFTSKVAELARKNESRSQDPAKDSIKGLRTLFGGGPTSRLLIASVKKGLHATYRLSTNVEFVSEDDGTPAKMTRNTETPKEPAARIEVNLENGEIKVYYPDKTSKTTTINGKVLWDVFLLFAKNPQQNISSKRIVEAARQAGSKTKWAVGGLVRDLRKHLEINPKDPSLIICPNAYRRDYQYNINAEIVFIGQESASPDFLSKIEGVSKIRMETRRVHVLTLPNGQQISIRGLFKVKLLEYLIQNFQQIPVTLSDITQRLYGEINDDTLKKSRHLLVSFRKVLKGYEWRISNPVTLVQFKQGQRATYNLEKIPDSYLAN